MNTHFGNLSRKVGALSRCYSTGVVKPKTGILLLNMGGPQHIDQVHDYLYRIMTDRDMIQLPFQSKLGPWIAKRRTPEVQKKYQEIGGGSPILKWTNLQGDLMCKELDKISPATAPHKHYVGFRYVNPLTEDTLEQIEKDAPEQVVIFSQYPQYCCATSGSSFNSIYYHYRKRELSSKLDEIRVWRTVTPEFHPILTAIMCETAVKSIPKELPKHIKWSVIDRWATNPLLIKTFADNIRKELNQFPENKRNDVIILFSAHSIPLKTVNRGDAYPSEVGASVALVMDELKRCNPYSLVWQSKVGPLPWLEPFTDDAIKGYTKQGKKNFIIVPIAFVNDHIETLHELDIEYCHELAEEIGAEKIRRAAAPNDHPLFINALSSIVSNHLQSNEKITPKFTMRCPKCVNPRCIESKKWYSALVGQ